MTGLRSKIICFLCLGALLAIFVGNDLAFAQYVQSKLAPPPPPPVQPSVSNNQSKRNPADTLSLPFKVRPTVPGNYDDVQQKGEYSMDLKNPSNITTEAEYDYATGCYVIHTKLGDNDIVTPFILSADEYNNFAVRQSLMEYYRQKNAESAEEKAKNPFNFLDMQFGLGPLEKIFGPGGVQLKTQGSVVVNMGVKSNKTDNPAMSVASRRKTYFSFDQKIQASIAASVGDKMKFNMTYNTDATFDFDNKNLKLAYEGKEDEIIKNIEAGNVSMTTGSSLIRGSAALFGIKTKLQFGKLTATALVSQQNSESQTVNTKGGVQTTPFYITADKYDQNRNFFLSHFFRDNYDSWASKLPLVSSGVNITRIEVWITNKRGNFSESRNLMALMDVGENKRICNSHWTGNYAMDNPTNESNNMLSELREQYPDARYISQAATSLEPLKVYGFEGGRDYEKIESARLLSNSEYTLNSTLGYIQLKTALASDEVLAVAFQYTYHGNTYQVGEFSGDITSTDQSLYVKMLKGTTTTTTVPMWDLMMKNIYSLGAYQVQKEHFKLNIKYLSDTTGTELPYIPSGVINGVPLLQVMNLDRLDANNESNIDGRFDYIEGYTVSGSNGKVIFPVVEPFGDHLRKKLNDEALANVYCYDELYDTTLTAAQQVQDKNKFVLAGEYQASSGNTIKLNAMNVPRGSVVVTAGGVVLTENSDYTVDYNMGTVTITNQSIIDAGTNISVSLENQSTFSMQRKTLFGLDLDYAFNKDFHIGGTIMHYGEKALTEKVSIGDEIVNNTIWGVNMSYNSKFMWLTNLLNKIPTVNATAPSSLTFRGEFAQLVPHQAKSGSNAGSSYIDDFESTQSGIDLRSPYAWFLASTPYDNNPNALFPEAAYSNDVNYGKRRSLLSWYYIDRLFTQRNSSYAPGYIKNDLEQLSNPYVREVSYSEVFPGRELNYGESSTVQTLNLSFYPKERGPYNLDATNIDAQGNLLNPETRWGGIMRKIDNTNFEQSNIEYIQFWMLDPFMDENNPNRDGGYLYFNLGEMSEDVLKDGLKSYENGLPVNGDTTYVKTTNWGKVSTQTSMTYAFDTGEGSRPLQDVGLNGLSTEEEKSFPTYKEFTDALRRTLPDSTISRMESDQFSPLNDPAGDNYHFYRGYDYDEQRLSILDRYKHYNGTEGNSLSQEDAADQLYQSARSVPDVEDINQDNTLNEYERYFQYRIAIHPDSLQVGSNYITDKQVARVRTRDGKDQSATWYQFSIPLREFEKKVGTINDFSSIRFIRMFMTGFKETTHLRFATLELVRGEWRNYDYNLNLRGDSPASGNININSVNIEENASRDPVNYVLPPGVSRIVDSGQSQITQLNEQSMQMKVQGLQAGDARGVYRNTSLDLRIYQRLQMFLHGEALIGDVTNLSNGDVSVFLRLGSDIKNNYYEYEVPLSLTPPGRYNTNSTSDRYIVWPENNMMDINLDVLTNVKKNRNAQKLAGSADVSYYQRYQEQDPDNPNHRVFVMGNPSLSDVRVMMIGVRNNSPTTKDCVVWADELRVTDFDNDGGWAAKANATLNLSDIATVNAGFHKETYGFGGVNESLSQRRMDNFNQYNIAVQGNAGRFLPEKVKLNAPIYYSYSNEKTRPKYNPLDQDIMLDDALNACQDQHQRDSINNFAETQRTVKSFSISGLKFDVKTGKNPMPWDPANFTFSYSSNKQHLNDPDNVYENTNDYRGSFQYSWTPYIKPFTPFKKMIDAKNKNMKFFREWELRWLPTNIAFNTNMSRYYYEQQSRNETGIDVELPVAVSKNFLWDRQFSISWNFTKSLSASFNSNTTAHILEPIGQVNKQLFPDRYRDWRDSVWMSIKDLGTPWAYNQNFTATYKAPFSAIPILSFINASATYNATYRWDRGAVIADIQSGNTISNQSSLNIDTRFSFEQLYNKVPYLQKVNKRFSSTTSTNTKDKKPKIKKFQRTFKLHSDSDSVLVIKHNLNVKKVSVKATTVGNKPFPVKYNVKDNNNIEILTTGDQNIKFVITEVQGNDKNFWSEFAQYTTRALMSVRSVSVRWKSTQNLSLPQFIPDVGDVFGQNNHYDVMAPGLDFAFGLVGESYIERAKSHGWLLGDQSMTTPALYSQTQEFNAEVQLEPVKGLKITLNGNRTDNRTSQIQFMYDNSTAIYSGSYTKTHMAIATAFKSIGSSEDGYHSSVFDNFLANIPLVAQRIERQYAGTHYPEYGFMAGNVNAGKEFNPEMGTVNPMSSDVLIPAFMAAYSGKSADKVTLSAFPSLKEILPNWRVTYDGLSKLPMFKKLFKSFTLTHAYQCTYQVGSYNSYSDWIQIGNGLGFTQDALSGAPVPSSPYNISSVTITEKFAPLIGVNASLNNNLTFNTEYRDQRTLTLNSAAGQIVEAVTKSFVIGAGYKIANFNSVLKMKGKQQGVSNDLTLNFDLSLNNNSALIRKIESNTAQATSGTRTFSVKFTANYQMSKRITMGAFFDHQVNTPLVSTTAYPTTNSNYGLSFNMSLTK
ncbi:MAG: cell surface protein SprA [Bacteroidales bacterium]|nr:cell surface protein SprA [Candidatus Sodaliphilus aphodohippi]